MQAYERIGSAAGEVLPHRPADGRILSEAAARQRRPGLQTILRRPSRLRALSRPGAGSTASRRQRGRRLATRARSLVARAPSATSAASPCPREAPGPPWRPGPPLSMPVAHARVARLAWQKDPSEIVLYLRSDATGARAFARFR
ncbi:hypothetical protein OAO87_01670 [bacterium]|nr:hypothetical protein [bacterium]